jgi:hypothetical protein
MSIFEDIKDKPAFLEELQDQYIERQGLGAMPKSDFDALLVHLFLAHSKDKEFDSFKLSERFKIKETRLKALLETAAVKFEKRDTVEIWMKIIEQLNTTITEVDNIESGEVKFKLENPAYFRYVQREIRALGGTVRYDRASEAVSLSLELLFEMLNRVSESILTGKIGNQAELKQFIEKIKTDVIGKSLLTKIKKDKDKKLKITKILTHASSLASIGGLLVGCLPS